MDQRKPTFKDRRDLWVLKLAKIGRKDFATDTRDYENFYEDYFVEKDIEAYTRDRRMSLRREVINETFRKHLPPGKTVLDVGCGLGDVIWGMPDDYAFRGMDFAASNVAAAQRRLDGKAEIKQGNIYDIPFDDASADAALCLEVIEHIEDDARAMDEIARVLKPGGFLVTAVPHGYYWPEYERLMGHFRHYTRESYSDLLRGAGLEPEVYLPNYPRWHAKYSFGFVTARIKHLAFGRLVGGKSVYTFKWPWSSRTVLEAVADRLQPVCDADAVLDYGSAPTSTFILARKASSG